MLFREGGKEKPDPLSDNASFPIQLLRRGEEAVLIGRRGGVAFLNEGYASYLGLVQFFSLLFSGEEEGWGSGGCVYFSSRSEVLFMARGKGKKGKAVARGLRFAELGHKKPEKNLSLPNQALRAEKKSKSSWQLRRILFLFEGKGVSELSLLPPPLLPFLLLCIRRKAIVSYERGRSLSGRETFGNLGRRTHSAGFPQKIRPFGNFSSSTSGKSCHCQPIPKERIML